MEFVINLDRRTDRWEKFQKHNGVVERVSAVENRQAPACGCLNSHLKVLRIARDRKLPYVIIFEDDVILRKDLGALHQQVTDLTQKYDWDVLVFSISYGAYLFYGNLGSLNGEQTLLRVNQFFSGAYCLAVAARAYDRLIQMMESRKAENIDVDFEVYSKLCDDGNVFLTLPFLAEVLSDQSDLRTYDTSDDVEKIRWCEKALMINNELC